MAPTFISHFNLSLNAELKLKLNLKVKNLKNILIS